MYLGRGNTILHAQDGSRLVRASQSLCFLGAYKINVSFGVTEDP